MAAKKIKYNDGIIDENLKYLWYFVGAAVLSEILTLLVRVFEGFPLEYEPHQAYTTISMVVIPMTAVNTIYLSKKAFLRYCEHDWQIVTLKLIGMYVGVAVSTPLLDWFFYYLLIELNPPVNTVQGAENGDKVVMGYFKFMINTTGIMSNLFYATIIGLPVFIRQQMQIKADKELAFKSKQLEKIERLKTQAQLEALQAKVNPHFLHNALNAIVELINEKPSQAEGMVVSLSNLFRYSMSQNVGRFTTIANEIEMVRTYMSIELVRFANSLTFEVKVEDGLAQKEVPRFLLQPLVENAVKHGTSKMKKGEIKVQVKNLGSQVEFSISDNGPKFPESFSFGYGMRSVVDQLELFYPGQHEFELLNEPYKRLVIRIPYKIKLT